MIDERLQVQDSKRLGVKPTDGEIQNRFAEIERAAGMGRGQFRQYLQSVGVAPDIAIQQVEAQIAWGKIIRRRVRGQVDVSEGEIDDALARMRGQHAQARTAFERSLKLNGLYLPTRIALAGELLRGGDPAAAENLLSAGLAAHEKQPALRAMLADVAFRQQRYKEAVAYLEEALRLDPRASALYGALARAEEAAGNAAGARAAQAKAGDVPPYLEDPLLARLLPEPVLANVAKSAGTSNAPGAAGAAASGQPAPTDARQVAIGEANFLIAAGKPEQARAALDKALAKQPNDVILLAAYARLELAANRPDAARARATAATAADPRSVPAWLTQGHVLEVGGDDAGARGAYERAVALEPKAARAQVALGNLALRSGRTGDALVAYRAATAAQPDDAENWAHLLAAEFLAGQCAGALRETAE